MSKQEKLAALIKAVVAFDYGAGVWTDVRRALIDYQDTPDDPPQPPEMPECVRRLVAAGEEIISKETVEYGRGKALLNAAVAVRDHYRQPLKLEVGKVYVDELGDKVQIVWRSNAVDLGYSWLGVCGAMTGWYGGEGKSFGSNRPNLIREVPNG